MGDGDLPNESFEVHSPQLDEVTLVTISGWVHHDRFRRELAIEGNDPLCVCVSSTISSSPDRHHPQ